MARDRLDKSQERVYEVDAYVAKLLSSATLIGNWEIQKFGSTFLLPVERRFAGLKSVQAYVDNVIRSQEVRQLRPDFVQLTIKPSPYVDLADYRDGKIRLPETEEFLRELPVLHEVAHHYGGNGHGERFRAAYLKIVEAMMNKELAYLMNIWYTTGV